MAANEHRKEQKVCLNTHPGLPAKMRNSLNRKACVVEDMLIDLFTLTETWKVPPFQRDNIVNKKVSDLAEVIKKDPHLRFGTLIVGCIDGELYLLDGHHRKGAVLKSGVLAFRADVKFARCASMVEAVEVYQQVQDQIKRGTPNDRLKAAAYKHPNLQRVANECNFVTFAKAAKGQEGRLLTMSTAVQAWEWSKGDPPKPNKGGSVESMGEGLSDDDSTKLIEFLKLCREHFGTDQPAMWKSPNLPMCLWLYRRLVWRENAEDKRYSTLSRKEFGTGLAVLRQGAYVACLTNKKLSNDYDRDVVWKKLLSNFRKGLSEVSNRDNLKVPNIAGYTPRKD